MSPPPRVQRENTATKVVGAVLTIVEYLPRVFSAFGSASSWAVDFAVKSVLNLARGGAEIIGMAFICLSATMMFVVYYDPQTKIACFMKPQLCECY
jgi:predicted exporter